MAKQYSFIEKKASHRALKAISLGAISVGIFMVLLFLAFITSGQLHQVSGGLGFVGLLLSAIGFGSGVKDMYQSKSPNIYTTVGALLSGVILMIWIGMFIWGLLS